MDYVKFKEKNWNKNLWQKTKLCFNCLSKAHMLKGCQSKFRCPADGCRQKYHTLLHKKPLAKQNGNSNNGKQSSP